MHAGMFNTARDLACTVQHSMILIPTPQKKTAQNILTTNMESTQPKASFHRKMHLHEIVKNVLLVRTGGEPQRKLSVVTAAVRQTRDLNKTEKGT
jgi:hypothetical protein